MKELNLKETFKEAAEVASQVPENMQQAAFIRALDILLGDKTIKKSTAKSSGKKNLTKKITVKSKADPEVEKTLQTISRTKYPMISKFEKVLDRSLQILKISKDDCDIDGLSSTQIATLLTEKFRLRTSRQAVQFALSSATNLVDEQREGRAVRYRIMHPGEEHLNKVISDTKE